MGSAILGARNLTGCEHRLALDFAPAESTTSTTETAEANRRIEAAQSHRREVIARLYEANAQRGEGAVVLVEADGHRERVEATRAAMDAGVRWIERRSSTYGPMARAAERWFGKAAYPLVVIAPNNYVCLFAGAGGMSVAAFAALNLVGTLGRLLLLWYLTDALADPLDWVRDLIAEHRLVVLAISAAAVGLSLWLDRRAGGGEIDGLLHLEEEIEADADAERAPGTDSGDGTDDA